LLLLYIPAVANTTLSARIPSALELRIVEQVGSYARRSGLGDLSGADPRQQVRGQPNLLQRADPAFDQLLQEKGWLVTARFGQKPEPALDGRIDTDRTFNFSAFLGLTKLCSVILNECAFYAEIPDAFHYASGLTLADSCAGVRPALPSRPPRHQRHHVRSFLQRTCCSLVKRFTSTLAFGFPAKPTIAECQQTPYVEIQLPKSQQVVVSTVARCHVTAANYIRDRSCLRRGIGYYRTNELRFPPKHITGTHGPFLFS
jgi:hypothetical protein